MITSNILFFLGSCLSNTVLQVFIKLLKLWSEFPDNFPFKFSRNDFLNVLHALVIILLYSKCDQASDLWQQLELTSEAKFDLRDTVDWGKEWLVDFNAGKVSWLHSTGLIILVLLMWKWMGLFLIKNHLLRC